MRLRIHPQAVEELDESIAFYEERDEGLGKEFASDYANTVASVVRHPLAAPKAGGRLRSKLFRRFPFRLVNHPSEQELLIVAIAHCSRKPGYWRGRFRR